MLENKVVVITGASRGLGEALALRFAQEKARLVLAARSREDLDRVKAACETAGASKVIVTPTDISDEKQVAKLVDDTVAVFGGIDVFVANAGASYLNWTEERYSTLDTYPVEVARQLMDLNVIGTWLCMKSAFGVMKEGSSFIAVGSGTGRMLHPGSGFYAISKGVIDSLAAMAAKEQKDKGIRVNVLTPGGMVDTHLFGPNKMRPEMKERVQTLPDEIMNDAAVWLASDDSKDVTGAYVVGRAFNEAGAASIQSMIDG